MFKFNFWSLAIGTGIVLGYFLALYRARKAGIPEKEFEPGIWCAIVVGFVVSRIVEVLFYQPQLLKTEGWTTLFKVTEGISSYGGFLGGALGLTAYYAWKRKRWWKEADILVEAFMIGWVFGRLGCTVAGDHPGPRSADAWWAFHYPDGPRHNLGFYEMLLTLLLIVPMNFWLNRRPQPEGRLLAATCLVYGIGRFILDIWRATDIPHPDPRYAGFTLAHYTSATLVLFGAALLIRTRRPLPTTG